MSERPVNDLHPLAEIISPARERPLVISHRGAWTLAPENSIEAMLLAAQAGADMVELDVQRTVSGLHILMHDDTTDRMTNRSGTTLSVQAHELATLTLKQGAGGAGAALSDAGVPSLQDALEAARGRVHLNLDTKHRRDLESVGDVVRDMGMSDQVLIKMVVDPAAPDAAIKAARWYGDLTFMPVMLDSPPGRLVEDALAVIRYFGAQMLEISFTSLGELGELADVLRSEGVRLWVNTLDPVHPMDLNDSRALKDPDAVWGTLLRHSIGAIQTDQAEALADYLNSAAAPA